MQTSRPPDVRAIMAPYANKYWMKKDDDAWLTMPRPAEPRLSSAQVKLSKVAAQKGYTIMFKDLPRRRTGAAPGVYLLRRTTVVAYLGNDPTLAREVLQATA